MQAPGHDQWVQPRQQHQQQHLDMMRPARDYDNPSPPPIASASVNGPVDPMEFYHTSFTPTPPPLEQQSEPSDPSLPAAMQTVSAGYFAPTTTHRAASRSPNRNKLRSASGPAGIGAYANKSLGNTKSHPVLLPSRTPGTVKDIANRFDQKALPGAVQPALTVRTSNERYRRDIGKSKSPTSPTKTGSGSAKLQKRRPGQPKSPHKSASTSFDTGSSFGSGTLSTKSQPHAAFSPRQAKQAEQKASRPLFGEITSDGQWNGNFQLDGYGPLPKFQSSMRRGSDGSIALSHGRSQSQQESVQPLSAHANHKLHHQRSRSDLDYMQGQLPIMPNLNTSHIPMLSPFGSPTTRLRKDSPTSRIPIRPARRTGETPISAPQSRASSSLSNYSGRNKLSKSPTRMKHQMNKENDKTATSQTRRYNPPPLSTGNNNQLLSAKIVPPPPKLSPPLRSSRPRQPVSAATTAASRARAAGDRLQNSTARGKPSEQWMGKPYDASKEQSRRKIPELGKVDFAERRARIQQAISQNLDETKSQDDLKNRSRSRSRQVSVEENPQAVSGAVDDNAANEKDQQQQPEGDTSTVAIEERTDISMERPRGLSLDTSTARQPRGLLDPEEPTTAGTEHTYFEIDDDESPVLGRQLEQSRELHVAQEEPAMLLTSATYQPALDQSSQVEADATEPPRPSLPLPRNSVLENVMLMRQRSGSSSDSPCGEDEGYEASGPSADEFSSDADDRWDAGTALITDQGSIRIMLDNDPALSRETSQDVPWSSDFNQAEDKHERAEPTHELAQSLQQNHESFAANGWNESPDEAEFPNSEFQATPRKNDVRQETLKPATFQPVGFAIRSEDVASNPAISRALDEYNATGTITPDLLQEMEKHSVDLARLSHNGGSNAIMVQNLLDSIANERASKSTPPSEEPSRSNSQYEIPAVTPDTPPDALTSMGTAVVFGRDEDGYSSFDRVPELHLDTPAANGTTHTPEVYVQDEDEDFAAQIAKANEQWERKQRGEADSPEFEENFRPPTPPPKDLGYTPRSSIGPASTSISPSLKSEGLRISTAGHTNLSQFHAAGESASNRSAPPSQLPSPTLAPPLPNHAPPPPPPGASLPYGMPEVPQLPAPYAERASSEASPRLRKSAWGPSPGSSRPSVDSQRHPPHMPTSNSMSSFGDASTRVGSIDVGRDSHSKSGKTTSPGPEQKRLQKRRHVIMELLNTENSYHQDLKIIEDIYKATVDDFVSADDKKTLFGNCDEIERFSLKFFDELRKAVTSIYQPSKGTRWHGKRGSISTTQSDGTASSTDSVDEEKDRGTTIGKCFLEHLSDMEVIYGNYLKNHDAANQRLAALQTNPTVKCWLDECHNNASDITSAWDLDSLLVKPTQRISKYPLMLQQLLDSTPADHPDHDALKSAAKDSIAMLTRINESKKRTELVEQMIGRNNKGKESDVRAGLAKAFGRRSEKVRERIGMSETVHDDDFEALAHKFGGHYIRLQIVLRDVQDYVNSSSRAVQQISAFASALEAFGDVSHGSLPEMTSKWRRYGHAIRDLTAVALAEHKATLEKRVITPMVACIKLHENPQAAIAKRKKRVADYARCKNMEKRGEKPDRKTIEAADMYVALNEQLKLDLPKLYDLTASLVRACLNCFLDIQLTWQDTWQKKLRPLLEDVEIPASLHDISPAFHADYELVRSRVMDLGIINGSMLANAEYYLSPTNTIMADSDSGTTKRPSTQSGSRRTLSIGSDRSPNLQTPSSSKRQSGINTPDTAAMDAGLLPNSGRIRSNSSISNRGQTAPSSASMSRQWSAQSGLHVPRPNAAATSASFSGRPSTANLPSPIGASLSSRPSIDQPQSPRPTSSQTYFNVRPDYSAEANSHRFSGIFSSAMPPNDSGDLTLVNTTSTVTPSMTPSSARPTSSSSTRSRLNANENTAVLFVAASLFEFNIDKARQEGGYPYLVYTQGEVFDIVAQKGELWLGKNQDDPAARLGWLWEQVGRLEISRSSRRHC
jgi:hypothetical protein